MRPSSVPLVYFPISHFGPGVEEIQSLDEIINPGA